MADKKVRVSIGTELLSKSKEINVMENVKIFYDSKRKAMLLCGKGADEKVGDDIYFIATHRIDSKGRINVPSAIRTAFLEATYLPAVQNGKIYILIIEHEKKSE